MQQPVIAKCGIMPASLLAIARDLTDSKEVVLCQERPNDLTGCHGTSKGRYCFKIFFKKRRIACSNFGLDIIMHF